MQILKIIPDTVVDGPGLRTSIYFAGCKVHCKGCHNPESWNFTGGKEMYPIEVYNKIKEYKNRRVTLTGGNPLDQENLFQVQVLCELLKRDGYNIWLYSGYTWEHILSESQKSIEVRVILNNIDALVDGPFIMDKKDRSLLYRGSSNQRIIDVKKSLKCNKVVLYENTSNDTNSI